MKKMGLVVFYIVLGLSLFISLIDEQPLKASSNILTMPLLILISFDSIF